MKRRQFLGVLGSVAGWPWAAKAEQATMPKVGYLWMGEPNSDVSESALRQGLAGYVTGGNLVFEGRYAKGNSEKVPALIGELLALRINVLATVGSQVSLAARRATSTLPIVCVTGDPVALGLVNSLNRPEGNVTGLSLLVVDYSSKWLELMKEALPKLHRVAALWNPDNPGIVKEVEQLRTSARALDLDLTAFLGRPGEIDGSLAEIAGGDFDGLVVTDDPSLVLQQPRIIAFAAERQLPALGLSIPPTVVARADEVIE